MNKVFPDDYAHAELAALVIHHRNMNIDLSTRLTDTREKLMKVSRELSQYKKNAAKIANLDAKAALEQNKSET